MDDPMNKEQCDSLPTADRKAACMESLMHRLGIDSALVGVPKLARAIGLGSSTIYAYMRDGRFFMPYRLVNGTPMVRVDDLVDWYLSPDFDVRPTVAVLAAGDPPAGIHSEPAPVLVRSVEPTKRGRKRSASRGFEGMGRIEFSPGDVVSQAAADKAVDGVVASVMARMQRRLARSE